MTQALPSSYVVPALQIVAAVAVLHSFSSEKSPLYEFIKDKVPDLTREFFIAGKNVIHDSPVIAFAAGWAYLNHLNDQKYIITRYPSLAFSIYAESPVKIALCVAGIFALKSALSTYLQRVMDNRKTERDPDENVRKIRTFMVLTIVPIAAGYAAAHYAGVQGNLAQIALYAATVIPIVKLLGKGFQYTMSAAPVREIFEQVYGWMN
jgi:hypothetical protein